MFSVRIFKSRRWTFCRILLKATQIYINRYFITIPLLEYMLGKNVFVTGTIMRSRVLKNVQLTSDKIVAQLGCSSSEQDVRSNGLINIVQWYNIIFVLLRLKFYSKSTTNYCKKIKWMHGRDRHYWPDNKLLRMKKIGRETYEVFGI